MASSGSNSSDSEAENDYRESDMSCEEFGEDRDRFCLYGNEPEYDSEELADLHDATNEIISDESDDTEEEGDMMNSSRLENLHWCGCSNCSIMPTLPESKCCREFRELLGDKLKTASQIPACVTNNSQFHDMSQKAYPRWCTPSESTGTEKSLMI